MIDVYQIVIEYQSLDGDSMTYLAEFESTQYTLDAIISKHINRCVSENLDAILSIDVTYQYGLSKKLND